MSDLSWANTRRLVHGRANGCCEYCQTCEINIGQTLHVEHINPLGGNHPDNLCLSCPNCNLSKATATTAVDPLTTNEVPLFNPRLESWNAHFQWTEQFTLIEGQTATGRATVVRLKLNRPRIVLARKRWVQAKLHPINIERA